MSSPSSDIPNLGNIADTLQNISRSFSNLCNELGRLENLPSVDLLTQLKTLNESIAVKEEQKEIRAQLVGSEEKTNRLEEQVKKLSQTVASLESQLVLAQKERDTFQSKIDDHLAAIEYNAHARLMNIASTSTGAPPENSKTAPLLALRPENNQPVNGFPSTDSEHDAETLDTVLAILGISSPDDLRQRREMSAASIGATLSNNASSSGGSSGIAHVPVSKEMEQEEKKK